MSPRRAVFDCNVFLQILLGSRGAAHACFGHVIIGTVELFVTEQILGEIAKLPYQPSLRRRSRITHERVDRFIAELRRIATQVDDPEPRFTYARDPADAHYVNVAVATGAMLVVSNDRDLLDLMTDASIDGKLLRASYPAFQVLTPPQFLKVLHTS